MDIEILYVDECPNAEGAGARVSEALAAVGPIDATVSYRLLSTSDEAAAVSFAGSPTILIDGVDAFPDTGRITDLACRVYRTEDGLRGYPTVGALAAAIRERA
ncbi:hypothetical protein ABH922_001250 [Rhodococcus sp. 27YEA15]|uniref:alkylmercury lyase n=1 Tax=Rhodococcus sp. 27YEA15 TaxID=3156259 RepID=UPI003C7D2F13